MEEREQHERRKYRRVPFINEVILEGIGKARSSDISAGGMYVETVASFNEGTRVLLQFKLGPSGDPPIKSQALVKYVHHGLGIGLAFMEISPDDRQRIERHIDHLPGSI